MLGLMAQLAPQENATFWRAPEYGDMELLRATYITHRFALHYHEEYVIGVIERGHYCCWYQGAMRQFYEGQIIIVNPGEIHSGHPLGATGWSYRTLYPSVTLMRQVAYEATGAQWRFPYFSGPTLNDPMLAQRLLVMHRVLEQSSTRLERDVLLHETLGLLIQRHAANQKRAPKVGSTQAVIRKVCDYIHAHHAQNIALVDLARVANLSPYHLARVFKREMGLPPHKYLTLVRINRARHLLSAGHDIATVAQWVGFADQSHLSKQFKRVVGVPPGQFRAAMT